MAERPSDQELNEMDSMAHTQQMRIPVGPHTLVTSKEHHIDMIICGTLMFCVGFLAAAIVIAWWL